MDYAAATPLDERVLSAMLPYASQKFHNPSATYLAAKEVSRDIESARARIAHWRGVKPAEIIFTSGGTEANNLAVHGIMSKYPKRSIVTSAIEHPSILEPAAQYRRRVANVDSEGLIDLRDLQRKIDDKTVLVSVMYANNEIGTIQPLAQISHLIKEVRHQRMLSGNHTPLYFHTDACQAANYLNLYANTLGVDMMTINGGKIYGPKRAGVLYVRSGLLIEPQIRGGGQEYGLRSGTEDVMSIIGMAEALDRAQQMREQETRRIGALQSLFVDMLSVKISAARINGSYHKLVNNIHVTFPGQDNERLMMALDEHGIQCAVGSACSASSDEPSHVLKAIGMSDQAARSSLRFTLGRGTTEADIKKTVTVLKKIIK